MILSRLGNSNTITYGANGGNGIVTSYGAANDAESETWLLTCITAALGGGTFSVVGSVSGAAADLEVGVAYDNGLVTLEVSAGGVDWSLGDTITYDVVRGGTSAEHNFGVNYLQVMTTGDVSAVDIEMVVSISDADKVSVYEHTMSAEELAAGGYIVAVDKYPATKLQVNINTFTFTDEASIIVYGI